MLRPRAEAKGCDTLWEIRYTLTLKGKAFGCLGPPNVALAKDGRTTPKFLYQWMHYKYRVNGAKRRWLLKKR